jgi:hypothetical protein
MAEMKSFSSEDASMQIAVVTAYITLCTSDPARQGISTNDDSLVLIIKSTQHVSGV